MSRAAELRATKHLEAKGLVGSTPYEVALAYHLEASGPPPTEDVFEQHGDRMTLNLEPVVARNILESKYALQCWSLPTVAAVTEEIREEVEHVEPFVVGSMHMPSSAFCLLFKLGLLQPTRHQVRALLRPHENAYVRAIVLLYVRFVGDPKGLWKWFAPLVDDPQLFRPAGVRDDGEGGHHETIGSFARRLLTEKTYFSIMLPRIPIPIARSIRAELLLLDRSRALQAYNHQHIGAFRTGEVVLAQYSEDGEWYPGVLLQEATADEAAGLPPGLAFWVRFDGYDYEDVCGLAQMMLRDLTYPATLARPPSRKEAVAEVQAHDQSAAATSGRDFHSSRVLSFRDAIILPARPTADGPVSAAAAAASSSSHMPLHFRSDPGRDSGSASSQTAPRRSDTVYDDLEEGVRRRRRPRPGAAAAAAAAAAAEEGAGPGSEAGAAASASASVSLTGTGRDDDRDGRRHDTHRNDWDRPRWRGGAESGRPEWRPHHDGGDRWAGDRQRPYEARR